MLVTTLEEVIQAGYIGKAEDAPVRILFQYDSVHISATETILQFYSMESVCVLKNKIDYT